MITKRHHGSASATDDPYSPYRPWSTRAQGFADFYRRWLTERHLGHGRESRHRLALSFPHIFGRSPELALHGYESWLDRERLPDTVEAFARYAEPRHRRWLAGQQVLRTGFAG